MSLFAELKRRNVFRVAAAYLALGWIVTQVTTTVAPMMHLPEWIGPVVLWIGAIGFPFVLLFSWIYELTPEGIKKETEVDRTQSITHHTGQRLDYVVIALLVVAIGLYAFHEFRPANNRVTVVATPRPGTVASTSNDRSVAVLPFVDMSAARNQDYFADGISEELLNLLAQVPQLRVIARTSSFSFKGKEADIAEIARKLNVAYVLEGSLRTSGDKVRITAQLIRASDSSHVWSETYDREMTDVFKVQDEIAAAVVSQLKVTLLGAAPKARVTDPKAYALFLQARDISRQYNPKAFSEAIGLCKQALAIDPSYAPAWDLLGNIYFGQVDLGVLSAHEGLEVGRAALNQAIAHDATFGAAYGHLALYEGVLERDYVAAARHLEQAFALDPTNIDTIGVASAVARRLGRLELAIALGEYAVSRDPVNPDGYDALGLAYNYDGQIDKSIDAYRKLLSLAPESGWERTALGNVLMQKNEFEAALEQFNLEPIEVYRLTGLSTAYWAMGRKADSDAALEAAVAKYADTKPTQIARVYALRGDRERAFAMLDRAERVKDIDLGAAAMIPALSNLHDDPRWLPLLRRLGIAPEQLDAIKLDIKVPQ